MKKIIIVLLYITILSAIFTACKVSYSFQGTSIDYSKIKTMEIRDFTNQSSLVYAPLIITFNEHLKDVFTRGTKLTFVEAGADLELEGEIVRYDLTPMAVKEDAFASETRLTMAVRIRFRNNVDPTQDKEETISAYRDFPSDQSLDAVQDALIEELKKEIVDQIFNATLSNW